MVIMSPILKFPCGDVKGGYIWHDCTMLTDCTHLSWRIHGCQIHPRIYIPWCICGGSVSRSHCHSWPLDVSSNENAILDKMSVAMWNCHSWPLDVSQWNCNDLLDVSSNVKLPFLSNDVAMSVSSNVKLPFLTMSVDEIASSNCHWNCHSWPCRCQ